MKKEFSVKTIVAIGIGAALFVILGRFASIPTGFPNTNIETSYGFLALMAVLFGPVAGGLIGLIGHALKDLISYGAPWWSWVVCSGIVGVLFGWAGRKFQLNRGIFTGKDMITFNLYQVIANILAWLLIAPVLDIMIYSEPANKVFFQGIISASVNSISVGVIGTLLMKAYASSQTKQGSLKKDE